MSKKTREVSFDRGFVREGDREIEVLMMTSGLSHLEDHEDNQCAMCGFKIRHGKHSFLIHKYNGFVNGFATLLPVDGSHDAANYSQGYVAIGSDCKKHLPKEFVLAWSFDQEGVK